MNSSTKPVLKKEIKRFFVAFRDAIELIKELVIAVLSFIIVLLEPIPKTISSLFYRPQDLLVSSRYKSSDKDQLISSRDPQPESRQKVVKVTNSRLRLFSVKTLYQFLATVSTISLSIGVARLSPIAEWAKTQNECIEKTSINVDGDKNSLSNRVMTCNGGHN